MVNKLKIFKRLKTGEIVLGYKVMGTIKGIYLTGGKYQFTFLKNLSAGFKLYKEETKFHFKSKEFTKENNFVTALPEIKNLFFYNKRMKGKYVIRVSLANRSIKKISFHKFKKILDSNNMSKEVILTSEKRDKKLLKEKKDEFPFDFRSYE